MSGADLYAVLGVTRDATADEIRKAYRKLALKHHPDRGGSADEFQRVHDAYTILSDPERRARYDATGETDLKPDNTIAKVMSVLSPCLMAVLKEIVKQGGVVKEEDVVHHMRHSVKNGLKIMQKGRAELVKDRETLEVVVGRFEVDEGEENLLALSARDHLDTVKRQIEQVDKEIGHAELAVEFLKKCRYRADAKKLITQIPGFGAKYTASTWRP